MKNSKNIFKRHGWQIAAIMLGLLLLCFLLWYQLGSLTHGMAASQEIASQQASHSWHQLLRNPLNAPYYAAEHLVYLSGHHGITSLRLVSTLFGFLSLVLFYFVARQWHNVRVAVLASWLFISSSWFLHLARFGSPNILLLVSVLTIIVTLTPNRHGRQTPFALPSLLALLSIVLYVPGMVWLVVAGMIVQRRNILEAWRASRSFWLRLMSALSVTMIIAPLAYGLALTPSLIKIWLGFMPSAAVDVGTLHSTVHNLLNLPLSFVWRSSFSPAQWLGHLPLLSSFEIVMLLLGIYFYATRMRAARTRLIMTLAGLGWLVVGISGLSAISLLVPLVYLLVAGGIAYILHLWFQTFPNNPIARSIGIAGIMLTVSLTSLYQTRTYFVAWHYNPETTQAFQSKL